MSPSAGSPAPSGRPPPPSRTPSRRPSAPPSARPRPPPAPTYGPSAPPTAGPSRPPQHVQRDSRSLPPEVENAIYASATVGTVVLDNPSPGMTALALVGGVRCPEYESPAELSIALHPLRFSVAGDVFLGAVLGNSALCLSFAAAVGLATLLCRTADGRVAGRSAAELRALLRLPGLLLVPPLLLFQGTLYAVLHTLLRPPAASVWPFVTALGLFGVVAAPIAVDRVIAVPAARKAAYVRDPTTKPLLAFVIGPGEWVSNDCKLWYSRYGSVLKNYKPFTAAGGHRAQFAEHAAVAALSASMVSLGADCELFNFLLAAVFLLHGAWCLRVMPYAKPRDEVHEAVLTLLLTAVGVCKGVGYELGDRGGRLFRAADGLLIAAAGITMGKLLLDLLSDLYVVCSGRRGRLQATHVETQSGGGARLLKRSWSDEVLSCGPPPPGDAPGCGPPPATPAAAAAAEASCDPLAVDSPLSRPTSNSSPICSFSTEDLCPVLSPTQGGAPRAARRVLRQQSSHLSGTPRARRHTPPPEGAGRRADWRCRSLEPEEGLNYGRVASRRSSGRGLHHAPLRRGSGEDRQAQRLRRGPRFSADFSAAGKAPSEQLPGSSVSATFTSMPVSPTTPPSAPQHCGASDTAHV
eukprot:TRINITY_DN5463_c1_g1_i4.p1 TRINITY_DN5463_c1_g1~~TRINITY_DN5463_c1_g1_i4.p1  ORF type:complete len:636 (+),score=147.47 TRINITY_DN5463_c1_g1_i4:620-2527(+)